MTSSAARRMKLGGVVFAAVIYLATGSRAEERFPIGFWYGPPASANRAETWHTVADAGFNLVGPCFGYSPADNQALLAHCKQAGLQALIVDARIQPEMVADEAWRGVVRQVVADYQESPALFGYYLHDEPGARWFPVLGEIHAEFKRHDPHRAAFINLLPNYAPAAQRGTRTHREYLRRYVETVRPSLLSYDHYPLLKTGDDRGDYFENLETVRSVADSARLPVWSIIQVAPHEPYRDPTAAELRWQANTSLAYGARGLLYFTYWPPPSLAASAIVDAEGKPTHRYAAVQELNRSIQALGPTLLALRSTAVYHTGTIPSGCRRLPADALLQVPADKPLVVGCFTDTAQGEVVLLVNRDYRDSQEFEVVVRADVATVSHFDAAEGKFVELPLENKRFKQSLEPGGARLFALQTRFAEREPRRPTAEINFEFKEHDEDWSAAHSLSAAEVVQGVLRSTITGDDPYFVRTFLAVPADRYRRLRVKLKTPAAKAQLYWLTADEREYDDARHLDFATQGDGEFHEYVLDLDQHPGWKGQAIRAIRLDPAGGGTDAQRGETVEIDYVRGE